ncbi:hypothetical protein LIT25_04560 [Bacillus sp. F19]|nr:hypothetical protein LIT25_04560 [Bacillus sp. F19]
MSKDAFKKIVKKISEQSKPIITTALITGATRFINEMDVEVSGSDVNQSPRILTTLRNGAVAAGQEMMTNGLEGIKKNRA